MIYPFLFLALSAAWLVAYFAVIRPKLASYKATAGVYARIESFEGSVWQKFLLHAKGAKVAGIGIVTSTIPVLGTSLESLNGVNWAAVFPSDRAATIAAVLGFLMAVGPLAMVIVHMFGIEDAASSAADAAKGA